MRCDVHGVEGCDAKCCEIWKGSPGKPKQETLRVERKGKMDKTTAVVSMAFISAVMLGIWQQSPWATCFALAAFFTADLIRRG